MYRITKTIFTSIVLAMAILQAPLLYYFADGFLGFVIVIPYLFLGSSATLALWFSYQRKGPSSTRFHLIGIRLSALIGIASLLIGGEVIETLDFNLRLKQRNKLVNQVKEGKLVPNVSYNNIICTLSDNYFPPISNGGDEIAILKHDKDIVTVEFYIDRGLLDHYSAFVYTNDNAEIAKMDSIVIDKRIYNFRKLQSNWYRVAY